MLIQRETYNNQYITQLHSNMPGNPSDYFVEFQDIGVGLLKVTWEIGGTEIELNAILDAHNSLAVGSDKLTIIADGIDTATIACSDAEIATDSNIDWTLWSTINTESDGSKAVSGGSVDLTFNTDTAGTYVIEIKRQGAENYESGYVTIEATEAT